jgi:hypothetical protein
MASWEAGDIIFSRRLFVLSIAIGASLPLSLLNLKLIGSSFIEKIQRFYSYCLSLGDLI